MRKRTIAGDQRRPPPSSADHWLDLGSLADVEVTSEDPSHPIESALLSTGASGWRADGAGEQTIRLIFTKPQRIRRVRVEFGERHNERTQQFTLRWLAHGEESYEEIVRQQWNFSPRGATSEIEDYRVELPNTSALELAIIPDISGGDARASLDRLRLA